MPSAAAKRNRRRRFELAVICAVAALLAAFILPRIPALNEFNALIGDKIIAAGPRPSLAEFVFVAIDDPSIKMDHLWPEDTAQSPPLTAMTAGWPWPRDVYAAAIEKLLAAGARVVILDLILDAERPGDAELRATLDRHRSQVVIGANLSDDVLNPSHRQLNATTVRHPAPSLIPEPNDDPRVGYVNFWPESDGVVRGLRFQTVPDVDHPDATRLFSLTTRTLQQLGHADRLPADLAPRAIRFGDLQSIKVVPFYSLFLETDWRTLCLNGALFTDKIVMIGPSAGILQDFHVAPIGKIPGPLLHINAIAATLAAEFYRFAPPTVGFVLIALAALIAFLVTTHFPNPVASLLSLAAIALLFFAAAWIAANRFDLLVDLLRPVYTLFLSGVSCIAWTFAAEKRESGRMRSTLERYVSRNVVREILDNRDDFLTALGGTRRPMTIFFSDVRGFTSFSERNDATNVVAQLNEYLAEMVRIIFKHQGTVDKFMGDGIMAVWGNVLSEGETIDARRAAHASLEMLASLRDLNAGWTARGLPPFAIGIGLNHGDAVFGNIGSTEKMEPTVIGDAVNLASRVESLTKKYGLTNCVTDRCADLLRDEFHLRTVDLVQVVGKSHPVGVYSLIAPKSAAPPPEWLDLWERTIASFRSRQFIESAAAFRSCLTLIGQPDKLGEIYLARAETYAVHPPPPDWSGTEIATSK